MNRGSNLIRGLMSPGAFPHPVSSIRLIETHISWVLLTGQFAYKIKKPVNFGFLDFSTLELRHHYCHEELRLNRRLAADWYLDVVPITGSFDAPCIAGNGEPIEYAVRMRQFPTGLTLKDRVRSLAVGGSEIDQVIALLADFHATVDKASPDSPYGSSAVIKHWVDENLHHIKPRLADPHQLDQMEAIERWSFAEWRLHAELMDQRKRGGFVRECHGDMHLGNMTLIDGKVVLFDCIEFNPQLRWIDVVSEVAFLIIDLLHFRLETLAWRVLNLYFQRTGDYQGIALLRYYLVYRALVLAKVALLRAEQQHDPEHREQNHVEYCVYADLAERFTQPRSPVLYITHGFSGSGKSCFAGRLAECIGALQIRSDIERKRLFGYRADQSSGSPVDGGIYSEDASEKTYAQLARLAKSVLEAGFSVIVDAAFLKKAQREPFRQLAEECKTHCRILDFQASDQVLHQRIQQRQNQDASEATLAVLHRQQQTAEPLDHEEQSRAVTVNSESESALEKLLVESAQ
ncbi:MAG: bifunctional aminoglycoside phosphotransferase/ATP-binding protein [Gammaproteobacteria bacterium]